MRRGVVLMVISDRESTCGVGNMKNHEDACAAIRLGMLNSVAFQGK